MELKLTRKIKLPSSEVFKAYSNAALLSQWFTTNAKVDFKVGGRFSNDDRDEGEYLEIIPDNLIKFTWENKDHCPGTIVEVKLNPLSENETEVTITHSEIKTEPEVLDMKEGWSWSLDCVKLFLEEGKKINFEEWKSKQ